MAGIKMRTERVQFSDAEIRAQAVVHDVRELRDVRYPELRLRFGVGRQRATWSVVIDRQWHKVGRWPGLTAKAAVAALPSVLRRLAESPRASAAVGSWRTAGELLGWYEARMQTDRNLSAKRKETIASVIRCHLAPKLGTVLLADLDKPTLDQQLIWPLQAGFSLAYTRLVFGVLMVAFRTAQRLSMISANPLAGLKFTDFVKARQQARDSALRPDHVEQLLSQWGERYPLAPDAVALAVLMLACGTRVGETRQAKWSDFSHTTRLWHLAATATKTRKGHVLPLTPQLTAFLERYQATQRGRGYTGAYLFPGGRGKPITARQATAWFTTLSAGEWRSHDLRKVARTSWLEIGIDYLIGELLLNHAMGFTAQSYIHTHAEQQKRDALERWHAHLDQRGFGRIHRQAFAGESATQQASGASNGAVCGLNSPQTDERGHFIAPAPAQHADQPAHEDPQ